MRTCALARRASSEPWRTNLLQSEHLRDLLASGLETRDRLLVLLAVKVTEGKSVSTLKEMALGAGWRRIDKVNVSMVLGRAPTLAAKTSAGWELTANGRERVATILAGAKGFVVAAVAPALRAELAKISSLDARLFVEESIKCYEARLHRAAVVLSWEGAIAVLHDRIVANHLIDFNNEAVRRTQNAAAKYQWKPAKSTDDLGRMDEFNLLEVLAAISVLGKNVKEELQKSLKLRNACGHPNTYKLGDHTVAAHLELLILNVFSKF